MTIHQILCSTASSLMMGFMDDVSLWRPLFTISSDGQLFCKEGAKIGLYLNVGKCEIIFKAPFNPEGSIAGFSILRPADANLLGTPLICLGSATDHALEGKCSDLRTPGRSTGWSWFSHRSYSRRQVFRPTYTWALHWLVVVQPQIMPSKPDVQTYIQPLLDLKLLSPTMQMH